MAPRRCSSTAPSGSWKKSSRRRKGRRSDGSMSAPDFETRLKQALTPVDPPVDLEQRLELTLTEIVEVAADELEAWELHAFKDPRNWVRVARPAAAIVIGTGAAVGLVVLRT